MSCRLFVLRRNVLYNPPLQWSFHHCLVLHDIAATHHIASCFYHMRCQVFFYEDEAQVASLSPVFVPSTGGTRITLKGSGFPRRGDVRCRFGEDTPADDQGSPSVPLPLTSYAYGVSAEELACNIPSPGFGPGESGLAHVYLATTGNAFRPTNMFVNFVPEMKISSIVPRRVGESGEHDILLGGTNFPDLPDLACRFGGGGGASSTVSALWLRSTAVRCVAPPLTPGDVLVEVTFNGIDFVVSPQMLTVDTKLTVTDMAPFAGPISGGTEIIIKGTGFSVDRMIGGNSTTESVFYCLFGESRTAAGAIFVSPGSVSCQTPPGFANTGVNASGLVPVTVAKRGDDGNIESASIAPTPLEFFYFREAVLTGVTPGSGPMAGGTRVALSGLREEVSFVRAVGVEPDLRCRFGAAMDAAVVTLQEHGDELFCVAPPSLGAANKTRSVSVTASINGGADFFMSEAVFVYFETPQVVSVDPSAVSVKGVPTVRLEGRSFPDTTHGVKCIVGPDAQELEGVRVSSTVLECVAPPHSPGFALVSATFNGVDITTSTALLEYREDLSINSISPAYAVVASGTKVTLRGTGFVNSSLLSFRWGRLFSGDAISNATRYMSSLEFVNDTAVTFTAPYVAMDNGGNGRDSVELRLEVSNNGLDFTSAEDPLRFTIAGKPRVNNAFPRYGRGAETTVVTIIGTGFVPAATSCRFGSRERNTTTGAYITDERLNLVPADVRNSTHLRCAAPAEADHLIGEHFIEVVTGAAAGDDALAAPRAEHVHVDPLATAGFTFIAAAGVTAVEPTALPESSSAVITIEGYNFTHTGLEACRFGGEIVVSATWWNESAISCQALPFSPGSVSLELSLNGGAEWLAVPSGLLFEPDRFVYSLSPSAGPLSGGSLVMVTGVGFEVSSGGKDASPGTFYCSFGHLEVSSVEYAV